MTSSVLFVLTTLPDLVVAEQLADRLVQERLAACITILPTSQSIYRWEGRVERAFEVPLLIKTTHAGYPALERRLIDLHPYDLPEIVALPAVAGLPGYLDWVIRETGRSA